MCSRPWSWLPARQPRLQLATNVAVAFPRNPVQLAHQAYDLQLLAGGRFTLGLGSQIKTQIEKRYGASFDRPVARMREMVAALRAIFATWETGEALDFQGEFWSHTLMPPLFNPGPNPHGPPPIALGGLGPQMLRLAAEVGDGVLVMPFNTATHFMQRSLPAIVEGLARGGRNRSSLTVTGEVIVCCGQNEEELEIARVRRPVAPLLLRVDTRLSPGARGRRVGGAPARAQQPLQVGTLGRDAGTHRR